MVRVMDNELSPEARALLDEIEAFMASSGMTKTRFGLEVANDPRLVPDIAKGRDLTMSMVGRIRAYMRERSAA
jgi:hypothetical protein